MTIQQAIKSGKPFRRKAWLRGIWVRRAAGFFEFFRSGWYKAELSADEILATDWEVKK